MFLAVQESQAALHVPNVRAECLLKFQLRPVLEWQRSVLLNNSLLSVVLVGV